ncbi:MAG: carboxypeptidase regulatory-like domain-containing protein [Gammaproteobacteria bacterium]|nr:carboxypeptidase regulatory-like domain-containing protein [Gammaproteobacteria bacterium]MYF01502.1 carboxypeptidase regulatory-like domain-containing protein [Gammaproteobacteria bacterium]MYI77568.1 carboxypeptidase regulatory-like domain-containing protein [Gammaproteobacteria bacterium]
MDSASYRARFHDESLARGELQIMRYISILLTLLILGCAEITESAATPISIEIKNGAKGSEFWAGVVINDNKTSATKWMKSTKSKFQIHVPDTQSTVTIVLLTKNALPIIQSATPEIFSEGLTVEISKGGIVTGKVAAMNDGAPITDGVVSLRFDEKLGVQLPEDISIFSWELEDDGTFAVQGVPVGNHTFEIRSTGYLLAKKLVNVSHLDQQFDLEILMDPGYFVSGRIIEYERTIHPELVFRGEIDVELVPSDNQMEEYSVEFDEDDNFSIGPFAKDAVVNLQAWVPDGRRSTKKEIAVPAEDVELVVHHWVQVTGKVRDRETGEPVEEYVITAYVNHGHRSEIDDPGGMFSVEMGEYAHDLNIEAPGYLLWTTVELSKNFKDGADFDLGTIELDRAHTVKGRVVSRATGEPIAGASVYRSDGGSPDWNSRTDRMFSLNFNLVRTKTDTNGEFELARFPLKDGKISAGASGFNSSRSQTVYDPSVFLNIELDPKVSISGQVVSLDGEPVAARIVSPNAPLTQTEDGNFHMETFVGKRSFWAISDSGRSQVVEIDAEVGEVVEGMRIVIDRIARVRGNVTGLWKGETATVSADDAYDKLKSNGPYEIVGLSGGFHDIKAYTSFGRVLTGTISIGSKLEDRFDFEFPSAAALSGRVKAGTEGFGEYQIVARPQNERYPVKIKKTKSDGSYRFEDLVPDTYEIEIPSRAFTQQVEIRGDKKLDIDVGASELTGTVRSTSSMNELYVLIKGDVEDREISAWTQIMEDGSYRFPGLPQGRYSVRVTHPEFQARSQRVNLNRKSVVFDIELD